MRSNSSANFRCIGGAVLLGAAVVAWPLTGVAGDGWRLGTTLEAPVLPDDGASLSFTPRVPGVFDLDAARVTVSYAPLELPGGVAGPGGDRVDGFSIGGALAVDRFVVEGALSHATIGLSESETFAAAIGFGGFTTRMHFEDVDPGRGGEGAQRFGLGADLEARPGVSVGAGLRFTEGETEELDDTSGVVRFKLRF